MSVSHALIGSTIDEFPDARTTGTSEAGLRQAAASGLEAIDVSALVQPDESLHDNRRVSTSHFQAA